jgi:hypothetical protein
LAPPQQDLVQVIDVRDLAGWLVTAAERRTVGVFDAVGIPLPRQEILAEVSRGVADDASPPPEMIWASSEFLTAHGVAPWSGPESLPLWLPDEEDRGFMARDARPALLEGLELRPLAETARDTLAWVAADPEAPVTGLGRSRERELVAAWARTR